MYSLILKDILIQKRNVLFSFAYIIVLAVMLQSLQEGVYPAVLIAICYMLVAGAGAYDEKNKADVLLNSLPIKRSTIVLAKYFSVFTFFALGTVAYLVIMALIRFSGLPLQIYPITLPNLLGALLSISLLNSIYFPVYFKWGYMKTRLVIFIMFFCFFAGINTLANLVAEKGWLSEIFYSVSGYSDWQLATMILALTIVMLGVSYWLSVKAYCSREF